MFGACRSPFRNPGPHEGSGKVRRHSVTPPSATSSGTMNLINCCNCKHILPSQNHTNRTVSERRILHTHYLLCGCKYPHWQLDRRIHQSLSLTLLLMLLSLRSNFDRRQHVLGEEAFCISCCTILAHHQKPLFCFTIRSVIYIPTNAANSCR